MGRTPPKDFPNAADTPEIGSIDPSTIQGIRDAAGQELVDELVYIFDQSVEATLKTLRSARAGRDSSELRKTAHKWKGTCRTVGATRASQLCHLLENQDENDDFETTSALVEALEKESLRARTELLAHKTPEVEQFKAQS